jgi:UDP-3-O-[3-hydroxymyristoyl] glucosamine N-acyltransferase
LISTLSNEDQHPHSNGRGWVANTASVSATVYVGPYAIVYGHAELSERVRVEGTAQVSGHAKLSGDVLVCGNRWIDGTFHASTGVYRTNEQKRAAVVRLKPAEDGL